MAKSLPPKPAQKTKNKNAAPGASGTSSAMAASGPRGPPALAASSDSSPHLPWGHEAQVQSIVANLEDYHETIRNPPKFSFKVDEKGLSEHVIREISSSKGEPDWMLAKRLMSYRIFQTKPIPTWGPDLSGLNLDDITNYVKPQGRKNAKSWNEVPDYIKQTYEKLGIPQAERDILGGVAAQYDSEVLYHSIQKNLEEQGVIFMGMDQGVAEYPELVKPYFMTKCVPAGDNKFSALHGAVWSGGSFLYVPKGVKVERPLQIYFIMNYPEYGQFEHTLIIAEENSAVQYIEGCTAPHYDTASLHSAVVEIFAKKNSRVRYTSVQNWSKNVYNLNTKRSIVDAGAIMEWVGGTLGSGTTMLYPCSVLAGEGARADHLTIALAGEGQVKDTGAKVIHLAPNTHSTVISKSISHGGGIARYRGLVKMKKGCHGSSVHVRCDGLILDGHSGSDTVPRMEIEENDVKVGHEATVGRISAEQLTYLRSRGISEEEATRLIIAGFIEPVVKALPLEYAVEINRLIEMEIEGL